MPRRKAAIVVGAKLCVQCYSITGVKGCCLLRCCCCSLTDGVFASRTLTVESLLSWGLPRPNRNEKLCAHLGGKLPRFAPVADDAGYRWLRSPCVLCPVDGGKMARRASGGRSRRDETRRSGESNVSLDQILIFGGEVRKTWGVAKRIKDETDEDEGKDEVGPSGESHLGRQPWKRLGRQLKARPGQCSGALQEAGGAPGLCEGP